jgi:DNA processing protein
MFYQSSAPTVNSQTPWDADRLGWLGLASFDGFGTRTLHKLATLCSGNGEVAWRIPVTALEEMGVGAAVRERFTEFRRTTDPGKLAARLEVEGVRFVLKKDAGYPLLLKEIADPPFALFFRGALECGAAAVAIVGTRTCTSYGQRVAADLARDLGLAGFVIVSGLALGIDAVAHAAALDEEATCWAVLAGGCDDASIYPRHNLNLARRILGQGGCLMTEFPPGTFSLKHHFTLRNRIISGLCRAVIIVEADEGSGSLITAHLALEQNREVFTVPGPITSRMSGGTNKLLKLGAIPCTGAEDVITALKTQLPPAPAVDLERLPSDEKRVLDALDEPLLADEIARRLKLTAAEISRLLVALELKGLIRLCGGQRYALTQQKRSSGN